MSDNDEVRSLLAQLAQQRKIVDMMLTESFEAGAAYQSRLADIERLHKFVRTFDEQWNAGGIIYAEERHAFAVQKAREAVGSIPPTEQPHTPRT